MRDRVSEPDDLPGRPPRRITVTAAPGGSAPGAAGLLAAGMRDNPVHVAAFGSAPERRVRCLQRMFAAVLGSRDLEGALCAYDHGTLVGFTAVAAPGTCQPTLRQSARILPAILAAGPGSAARVLRWVGTWARHDLEEAHVHLGPLAVAPTRQGSGIGSQILTEHCERLDQDQAVGYLETDKSANVELYRRFGYQVVGQRRAIGVPSWFMRRAPREHDGTQPCAPSYADQYERRGADDVQLPAVDGPTGA